MSSGKTYQEKMTETLISACTTLFTVSVAGDGTSTFTYRQGRL